MIKDLSPSLRYSIYDGVAWALMIGFAEAFLSAYAIYLKATPAQIALLAAFPMLIPAFAQMLGVKLMALIQSRRSLITASSALQALALIPIAFVGLLISEHSSAVSLMLLLAAIYFFIGAIGAPAWNSLIGDLVPASKRGSYFGFRNKKIAYASLFALLFAGPVLSYFQAKNNTAFGFAVIFIFAFIARMVSAYWLLRHDDPPQHPQASSYFSFLSFIKRAPYSNFSKFVCFFALMIFSLSVCGPFFSLYLLEELKFSYFHFTILSAFMIFAQIFTLQHWGQLTDRFGNKSILLISGAAICLAPLFWTFSVNFYFLILVHIYSGFVWCGFNLAATNFLFDAVSPAKRARCAAYQSVFTGFATLFGSQIGSYIFSNKLLSFGSIFSGIGNHGGYFSLMYISTMLRVIVLIVFWKAIREVREVEAISHKDLIFRIINLRALSGFYYGFDSKKTQ